MTTKNVNFPSNGHKSSKSQNSIKKNQFSLIPNKKAFTEYKGSQENGQITEEKRFTESMANPSQDENTVVFTPFYSRFPPYLTFLSPFL